MVILYIDKCLNEIQEQKEVPVCYTGPYGAFFYNISLESEK
jgi:hypothetical protein